MAWGEDQGLCERGVCGEEVCKLGWREYLGQSGDIPPGKSRSPESKKSDYLTNIGRCGYHGKSTRKMVPGLSRKGASDVDLDSHKNHPHLFLP